MLDSAMSTHAYTEDQLVERPATSAGPPSPRPSPSGKGWLGCSWRLAARRATQDCITYKGGRYPLDMVFERQRLLLTLLDAIGEPVGHTDFQKLLLLYTQACEAVPSYEFVPYKFGGFSFTSYADKRKLIAEGLLEDDDQALEAYPGWAHDGPEAAGRTVAGDAVVPRQHARLAR